MARKFESVLGSQIWAWETLKCEDYLIIDGLLRVRSRSPHDREIQDLDRRFFDQGRAISSKDLGILNRLLAQIGEEPVDLVEGGGDRYAAEKGYGKAHIRGRIRQMIDVMPDPRRRYFIDQQRIEARRLYAANDSAAPSNWGSDSGSAATAIVAEPPGAAQPPASPAHPNPRPLLPPSMPVAAAPRPLGIPLNQEDPSVKQFELTFKQMVEKVGRLVIQSDTIQDAMVEYAEQFGSIDWLEPNEAGPSRIVAVREI